jgi:hypothetical protein
VRAAVAREKACLRADISINHDFIAEIAAFVEFDDDLAFGGARHHEGAVDER